MTAEILQSGAAQIPIPEHALRHVDPDDLATWARTGPDGGTVLSLPRMAAVRVLGDVWIRAKERADVRSIRWAEEAFAVVQG